MKASENFELQIEKLRLQKFQVEYLKRKQGFVDEINRLKEEVARKERLIGALNSEMQSVKDKEGSMYSQYVSKCQEISNLEDQLRKKDTQIDEFVKDLQQTLEIMKA
jgi:predicted  nucleic acid-binding Zn-ribbon protein